MADGRIVQVEVDEEDSAFPGLDLECELGRGPDYRPAGRPLPSPQAERSLLSRLGIIKLGPPAAKELSFVPPQSGKAVVWYGEEPISMWLESGEVRSGVVHASVDHSPLSVKLSVLSEEDIARIVNDRQRYDAAEQTLETTKAEMIGALRGVGKDVLSRCGATDIRLDKDEGVTYHTYGIPESTTFDFRLDERNVSIYTSPNRLFVSMANGDPKEAFRVADGLRQKRLELLTADYLPSLVEDPFSKLEEARDFSDTVKDIFIAGGFREFQVEYTQLTEALPLIIRLLKAPVDSNHEVLTPFFYGIHDTGQIIKITGPDTLTTISYDEEGRRLAANYTVDADGYATEELPQV